MMNKPAFLPLTTRSVDLQNCPFCNSLPITFLDPTHTRIACVAEKCRVAPSVTITRGNHRSMAARAWNRRF